MNDKHHHSGNGFIAGLIVGIVLTLLFTTKIGRKIVKTLTEEGMGSLGDILDFDIEDEMSDEMLQEDSEAVSDEKSEANGKKRLFRNLRKK